MLGDGVCAVALADVLHAGGQQGPDDVSRPGGPIPAPGGCPGPSTPSASARPGAPSAAPGHGPGHRGRDHGGRPGPRSGGPRNASRPYSRAQPTDQRPPAPAAQQRERRARAQRPERPARGLGGQARPTGHRPHPCARPARPSPVPRHRPPERELRRQSPPGRSRPGGSGCGNGSRGRGRYGGRSGRGGWRGAGAGAGAGKGSGRNRGSHHDHHDAVVSVATQPGTAPQAPVHSPGAHGSPVKRHCTPTGSPRGEANPPAVESRSSHAEGAPRSAGSASRAPSTGGFNV